MASEEQQEDISAVIESLKSIFKDVMNEDAIIAVVESCGGDLNQSMDAIMDITNDGNIIQVGIENENNTSESNEAQSNLEKNKPINVAPTYSMALNNPNLSNINQPKSSVSIQNVTQQQSASNALSSQRHGALPKVKTKLSPLKTDWTDQLRRIIENHTKGSRILILMRGAPGSGKTYLAKTIVEMLIGVTYEDLCRHIFSTDDFFMIRGKYVFNKNLLTDAHAWNQGRAEAAMTQGLSPIIIDNTNIEIWEMEPYARNAVLNGYIIEVVEPTTDWAKKPNRLVKINTHQVPYNTIKRMIDHYVNDITGESLLSFFKLSYHPDKCPPVYRLIPPFEPLDSPTSSSSKGTNFYSVPDVVKNNIEHTYTPSSSYSPNDQQDGECTSIIPHNAPIVNSDPVPSYTSSRALSEIEKPDVDLQRKSPIENTSDSQEKLLSELNLNEKPSDGTPKKSSNACAVDNPTEASEIFSLNQDEKAEDELESSSNIVNENQDMNVISDVHNEYLQMQEQYEQFSIEWDNGEKWEDELQTSVVRPENDDTNDNTPKPPRSESNPDNDIVNASTVDAWQQVSLFLPPWNDETTPAEPPIDIPVETVTSGTSIEFGDMDNRLNNYKVLETNIRDINLFHIPTHMKIPDTRNLDKSTSTTEPLIMVTSTRCSNEEKHFKALRKMFKNINKTALRNIFDRCKGEVNWAVEILLEALETNQIKPEEEEEEISDDEEINQTCSCMSAYQIIPDTSSQPQPQVVSQQEERPVETRETTNAPPKKSSKRETVVSVASVELKRQIEQNVVIDAAHYSEHCLKIMRQRRGITENVPDENRPSTSQNSQSDGQDAETALSSDYEEESNASIYGEQETVNVTLGKEFVTELDNLFGRTDMTYPDSVVPRINIPVSLLNELNALWIESLTYQLDQLERHREKIIKEDEDFARNLAMKEAELASGGKQPEVLNFKEIMDMELALSLYQKDVALWRHKEPMDMAAKLSREKLYNLFPDVDNDTLAELLMAHDNNFHSTVEVLLISTGQGSVLEEEHGVDKFISQNEVQMKQKILEEERKALAEVEWPLLPKTETPDMSAVETYRDQADRHLQLRNKNHQKANQYLSRGMLDVAGYYRSLAEFHKEKFEYNNSLAACSLMQIHAANCPSTATIDLHYFRVGEAKESLDLFIDTHIQTLRAQPEGSHRMRYHTLYCVTGRGAHSPGGPRIKPAIKRRLSERGLSFNEVNPGLLSTRVRSDSLLTHQLPS
ncbi:uncharacterized protein LOC135076105 [Ostrinia nubilalis]|uniref:uncharacterized protein LOC135076105 n=1 Tax=Ostrinia nubilalis TaxID=29057 RepID=UPI00308223EF